MYVFRIHIRPGGGSGNMETTFAYCLRHEILGVGWRTSSNRSTERWDEYFEEAQHEHGNLQICKYIYKWVSRNDLVWTRAPSGTYYLARVLSGWEYLTTSESKRLDIDIANIFRCRLIPVNIDQVPGKIIASFRGRRSIQKITNPAATEYSRHLWNTLSETETYQVDSTGYSDIFMMLDAEEVEDLLFLYLQSKGWYVVPHSRKRDTMAFEYLCVDPKTGQIASIQVKTGNTTLRSTDYEGFTHKVFLFQSNDYYNGENAAGVEIIYRKDVMSFVEASSWWFPETLKRKIEMIALSRH